MSLQILLEGLSSTRITEKKKSCDELYDYLNTQKGLKGLDKTEDGWDELFMTIKKIVYYEVENLKKCNPSKNVIMVVQKCNDLLFMVVKQANRNGGVINYKSFMQHLYKCMNSDLLREYSLHIALRALREHIMPRQSYWGEIEEEDWCELMKIFKDIYLTKNEETSIEPIATMVTMGALHRISVERIRKEADFVRSVCESVNKSSERGSLMSVLQFFIDFCLINMHDSRTICCQLGEKVLINILNLHVPYMNNQEIPRLIFECLLLQLRIHHLNGAHRGNDLAFANSWEDWEVVVRYGYFRTTEILKRNEGILIEDNGDSRRLHPVFRDVLVELYHQKNDIRKRRPVHVPSTSTDENVVQSSPKRMCQESVVSTIVDEIVLLHQWQWINLATDFLQKYPQNISYVEFEKLLQYMAHYNTECRLKNEKIQVLRCLGALIDVEFVQKKLFSQYSEKLENLWRLIWETTVRSVGLNHYQLETHSLLRKFILRKKPQPSSLMNVYLMKAVMQSVHSLKSLDLFGQKYGIPDTVHNQTENPKKILIDWILQRDRRGHFPEPVTAQVLIYLTLKQWPCKDNLTEVSSSTDIISKYKSDSETNSSNNRFLRKNWISSEDDCDDLYRVNAITKRIPTFEKPASLETTKHHGFNGEIFEYLIKSLKELSGELTATDNKVDIINAVMLFANVKAEMHLYKNEEGSLILLEIVQSLCELFWNMMLEFLGKVKKSLCEHEDYMFEMILKLMDVDKVIGHIIKDKLPVDFCRACFDLLKGDDVDEGSRKLNIQLNIVKILLKISMECRQEIHRSVFNCLITSNLDITIKRDYQLAVTILTVLENRVEPMDSKLLGTINEKIVTRICLDKYTEHDSALDVIRNLKHLFKHVAQCNDDEMKAAYLNCLNSFFNLRKNYGPKVSVAIIKCMGYLCKLDPEFKWTRWSEEGKDVAFDLPEFLKSPSMAVRMTCVENLVTSFVYKQRADSFIYDKQKLLFKIVADACSQLLQESQHSNNPDEIINRTSTIFYTFAMIFVNNGLLRQHALFEMIKLTHIHHLNTEKLKLILKKITEQLCLKNQVALLELYINYLLYQWFACKYSLKEFPYKLFDCQSDSEFYQKYTAYIIPILINEEDMTVFENVCNVIGKSISEIIQVAYSKLVAKNIVLESLKNSSREFRVIPQDVNFSVNVRNRIEECMPEGSWEKITNEQSHDIIVHIMQFVFDMQHFKKVFDIEYNIPEPESSYFSVAVFTDTLNLLKEKIGLQSQTSIIEHFILKEHHKVQQLLLNLKNKIYTSVTYDDKLIAFHRYVIFLEVMSPYFKNPNSMCAFIIRDITYTLINISKMTTPKNDILNCLALKRLNVFFDWILPQCHQAFEDVLVMTVSTLVMLVNSEERLSTLARDCIKKLVVDYRSYLEAGLKILDPFPDVEKFKSFRDAHLALKYGNEENGISLRREIEYFLKMDDYVKKDGYRIEGLEHLRTKIVEKKEELRDMYAELYEMKGCLIEGSCLHKLICVLVKLSTSTDKKESLEATRCLGLLGPADLTTLVLKGEENLEKFNIPPGTLAAKQILMLLLEYIVDEDNNVAMCASASLYVIMSSVEGKQVLVKYLNEEFFNKAYLIPFMKSSKSRTSSHVKINEAEFQRIITDTELWCPDITSHNVWIKKLVSSILKTFSESSFYRTLIDIVNIKVDFAEKLLPLLINIILDGYGKFFQLVSKAIGDFFSKHWDYHWSKQVNNEKPIYLQKTSVQCMLDIVNFFRLQRSVFAANNSAEISLLKLNYLEVALAAQFCSAYFSAVLYAELWVRKEALKKYNSFAGRMDTHSMTPFDIVCRTSDRAVQLQNILRETYIAIGDKDANYIQMTDPLNLRSCINMYKDINRWDLVSLFHDKQGMKGEVSEDEYALALKYYGFYHTVVNHDLFKNTQYDAYWRLSQWDENVFGEAREPLKKNFDYHNYKALKALEEHDILNIQEEIELARRSVINTMKYASLEACKNLYASLAQLQALQEFEELANMAMLDGDLCEFVNGWEIKDSINQNTFEYVEVVLSERICLMKILVKNGYEGLREILVDTQIKLSELARKSGNFIRAKRAIFDLEYVEKLDEETRARILLEDGQITWNIDKNVGIGILKHLLDTHQQETKISSEALRLYGSWMMETHSESSKSVVTNYFLKSVSILQRLQDPENTKKETDHYYEVFNILARYTDQEYQKINEYTKSSVFQAKLQNIEQMEKSALERKKGLNTQDVKKSIIICNRQVEIDRNETKNVLKERDTYLDMTIKYYLNNIINCDNNDINMFRIFSLWLENRDKENILSIVRNYLPNIPSYKIIVILPQLIPHINVTTDTDSFVREITEAIERCAREHPHHAIPIILSVANSNKDELLSGNASSSSQNIEPRVLASQKIMKRLKRVPQLRETIDQLECLMNALMELAYFSRPESKSKPVQMPSNLKIMKEVKNLVHTIVPTYSLPINKVGNYNNIIGVHKYRSEYRLVGGLNAPKKLKCIGTDGLERDELVKGQDDLRQDAVMQQVFTIMNGLFSANKTTSNLLIRTYKVVPMSKRSGVLEWVNPTMTLGEYLVGKSGAHCVYNSGDYSPERCRDILRGIAKEPYNVKLEKYLEICKNFKPIFHKFFETTFLQPTVWYEKRKAYTQSVATSSMCGYILGLGDRHVNNILIDKKTAEVVHIDFGIAFEQGRALTTPETVPFRLTRDIEAGMGVAGINGTFRSSCEKTLEVLRSNDKTIFTILEVLLYDPLYEWTITAEQAYKRQRDDLDSNEASDSLKDLSNKDTVQLNVRAERALNQLKEKLHGIEHGKLTTVTSVQGQVGGLIAQARDPANLSKLFHGWQPYL